MTPQTARARRRRNGPAAPRLTLAVQYAVAATTLPRPATLRRWAQAALERDFRATIRFVGTREGRALNARYRGKDHATNVLAFVYDGTTPATGDLVLCAPVVRREARAQGKAFSAHVAHLTVHGALHLQGYDHQSPGAAARMEALERRILAKLGFADPYAGDA